MKKKTAKIRYGVVGMGYISQVAVLPSFKNANKNSVLSALISEDKKKLEILAKKYNVPMTFAYDELEDCLSSGAIDALYVATPNDRHKEIVRLAAKYKVHVLCEKPMAVNVDDCIEMNQVSKKNAIKLMIAYRLHFESANLEAIKLCRKRKLGDLKFFNSSFSFQVRDKNNIRLNGTDVGGGALYDIGTYCINASRYIFKSEPLEVFSFAETSPDPRFSKSDETTSVIMRFPNNRLATFTVSFGAFDSSDYEIVGSRGRILLENAYDYAKEKKLRYFKKGKSGVNEQVRRYKKRDQFSAELLYFSDCILKDKQPEPGGVEGLADVKIIKSVLLSLATGEAIKLRQVKKTLYPTKRQAITRPPIRKRTPFHATPPRKSRPRL